jgi:hypothetical protein
MCNLPQKKTHAFKSQDLLCIESMCVSTIAAKVMILKL